MFASRLRAAALTLSLLAPVAAVAGPYSNLYVFGDSLSDNGSDFNLSTAIHNLNPLFPVVPAAPGSSGHFSNGPVAVDYLASKLGLPLTAHYVTPPFLGGATAGNNYAQGGATSGLGNASLPGTLTLGPNTVSTGFNGVAQQILDYKATTSVADPNALYIVWAGANDFVHLGSVPIAPSCAASANPFVCTAVTNVANSVASLAAMGATHILVPNLPDLGLTAQSIAAGPAAAALATAVTIGFNTGLANALGNLQSIFPGEIIPFDLFTFFDDVLADATALGFSNTTEQCLDGAASDITSTPTAACAAAGVNSYIFWDGIHPTTHAHALIGDALAATLGVPEPADLALFGLGLVALLAVRRTSQTS